MMEIISVNVGVNAWRTEEPTAQLRWMDGVLQQAWLIKGHDYAT